jgi:DNA polymerase-3 subunit gamma/tau
MFYLKHRPQTIEEIDNQEIREKIKAVFKSKNIPHAMLFTGPKGTGKTSTARIVAKIINCEKNLFSQKSNSIEPCNHCPTCQSITKGHSVDVVEIDAASNRGIEEARELISQIKFYPLNNHYKVYIVDEVHMLTKEAFNAFLKTLEEPPPSTIFILASTEVEKLPKTVVSRCLRFNFAKAKEAEILRMLIRIVKRENIKINEEVLKFIAKYSDHSFRDAAKLLEEVFIETGAKKEYKPTAEDVKKILGLNEEYDNLIHFLEKKDIKNTLQFIEKYDKKGGNFKVLIESLLDKFHLILLKKNHLETTLEDDYNFSLKEISFLIKLLQEAYNALKYSPIESLPLEMAVVEYLENNK